MNLTYGLNWGQITCVLASAAAAAILMSGCGDDGIGKHKIDENAARRALSDTGVTVPGDYQFGQMMEDRVGFSGKNTYFGRYGATTADFTDTSALMSANPQFPTFRSIDCTEAKSMGGKGLSDVGLSCTDTSQALLSINSNLDPEQYSGLPPDSETLLLLNDGTRTQLFIVLEGH